MEKRTITVKGSAKMALKPDTVVINITTHAENADYTKTLTESTEKITLLKNALTGVGFNAESIKTTDFEINTKYESVYDEKGRYSQKFCGYECRHYAVMEFCFDNALITKALTALSDSNTDAEFSLQYMLKDKASAENELLKQMSENAHTKAQLLAQASGVALGDLIGIDYTYAQNDYVAQTNVRMAKAAVYADGAGSISMDITPQNIQISDRAVYTWEIK